MNKKAKSNGGIIILLLVAGLGYYFFIMDNGANNPFNSSLPKLTESAKSLCTNAGGTIVTAKCCGTNSESIQNGFMNSCLIGGCGCAPINSHETYICQCPNNKCFNGTSCLVSYMP